MMADTCPSSEAVRMQFSKTVMCKFYAQGQCRKGKECGFAHHRDELRDAPDLTKTSMCKAWSKGQCPHTKSTCQFAHGINELRVTPMFATRERQRERALKASSIDAGHAAEKVSSLLRFSHGLIGNNMSLEELAQMLMSIADTEYSFSCPELSGALERALIDAMPSHYED
mmetsp:Transcript_33519/g.53420  ORF Transcript_33519/g.53420 Transcript_33519/m.53420 type:complete len:170 (-) Transcript_33519:40-549(-)